MSSEVPAEANTACSRPSSSSSSAPGRPAVGVAVDDEGGAAAQGPLADRVHVADDHVGREAQLQEGVGAAVDADEQRALLLEVAAAAQQLEVLLVVDAADDHEHLAAPEVDRDVGDVGVVDEEVALALDVAEGVLGEALELVAHVAAGLLEDGAEGGGVLAGARWPPGWSPTQHRVAVDRRWCRRRRWRP